MGRVSYLGGWGSVGGGGGGNSPEQLHRCSEQRHHAHYLLLLAVGWRPSGFKLRSSSGHVARISTGLATLIKQLANVT